MGIAPRAAILRTPAWASPRIRFAWASEVLRHTGRPVLIPAPLAVAAPDGGEGAEIGVDVRHVRDQSGVTVAIYITNYDRLHLSMLAFSARWCWMIQLHQAPHGEDVRASVRKRSAIRRSSSAQPLRRPNDWTELGTHAEFLASARAQRCWRNTSSMTARKRRSGGSKVTPARSSGVGFRPGRYGIANRLILGFDDARYELPPLTVHQHTVADPECSRARRDAVCDGSSDAQRAPRCEEGKHCGSRQGVCADLVNADDEMWLVWCDLNAESEALTKAIRGAVEVKGADEAEHKERAH